MAFALEMRGELMVFLALGVPPKTSTDVTYRAIIRRPVPAIFPRGLADNHNKKATRISPDGFFVSSTYHFNTLAFQICWPDFNTSW